jgi:galactokinase/mevalonate kinase-like predicted kinase
VNSPKYKLSVPARINVLGNPSDGVEGDFATISAAVNILAHARVEIDHNLVLEQVDQAADGSKIYHKQQFSIDQIPMPYDGELDLVKGGINRLFRYSSELRNKLKGQGVRITVWSDVPRQSGLGGSSLFVILTLAALRQIFNLDLHYHNDYVLAELTQRVEAKELDITCGYADRYVPLFGGIAYLDYRGKLQQNAIDQEAYATYERLDPWVDDLPLVVVSSGVTHESGDIHGCMRPRYIEEHADWVLQGGEAPPMVRWMQGAWETAWRGKIALLRRDWETFGSLMTQNHYFVNEMMTYCGFSDGAGWANNLLIDTAIKNGALGAKLTGAGGGGSVFALTKPGKETKLMDAWEKIANQAGMSAASLYRVKIARQGLSIVQLEG